MLEPDDYDGGEPFARIEVGVLLTRRPYADRATKTRSGAAYGNQH